MVSACRYTTILLVFYNQYYTILLTCLREHVKIVPTAGVPGGLIGGPRAAKINVVSSTESLTERTLVRTFSCMKIEYQVAESATA